MKKEWFVGIDVSKKWLDVAIFVENSDLKGFIHTQVNNDKQGYRELLRWLKVHDVDAFTCTYGMEHTGFYSDGDYLLFQMISMYSMQFNRHNPRISSTM